MIEAARKEEHISINRTCRILGLPRTEYYRIEELSLREQEYGHKKIWALLNFRHKIEITKYGHIQGDEGYGAAFTLEAYRMKYNTYRPHEALGYDVPANYYKLENMVGLTLNSK